MNDLTFGRPFILQRDRDISGVSGTGIVADGILWPDGHAAIHWCGKWALTTPHPDGLDSILDIHDHGSQGDLHVLWDDEDKQRDEFRADLADIYDLPAALLGTETERAHLRRMITRALLDAWEARGSTVSQPEQHCATFAAAVMPILATLQDQRDQALRANGRAYGLARTWRRAHGSAMFLVRAAGTELLDVLNEDQADEQDLAAAECSAQYYKANFGPARQCIRAAQHRGDHIDEHGFHWSDTVAVYPVDDGGVRTGQIPPDANGHTYLSTGCFHGDHDYCKSMTGLNGSKRPAECKKCGAKCICSCHSVTTAEA